MKALIISLILFSLLIFCTVTNAVFINDSASFIADSAKKLQSCDDCDETISELEDHWKKNRPLIGLSIPHNQLDKISDLIISLRIAYSSGNTVEVKKYAALLSESADTLRRTERISIENIF